MDTNFFQLNRRSRCLFAPQTWCGLFNHASPVGPLEFLCNTTPQRVAVVLPAPREKNEAVFWNHVYQRIASAWEHRTIGFQCERISDEAWTAQQPCSACALVRTAQVVVLNVQPGNPRAGSFFELAAASLGALKSFKEMAPVPVSLPKKTIVLISAGPANLPPHYQVLFHILDYADSQGRPDLDLLERRMLEIATSDSIFETAEPIHFALDGTAEPPLVIAPDFFETLPVFETIPDFEIRIVGETAATTPPEPARPASAQTVLREMVGLLKPLDQLDPVDGNPGLPAMAQAQALIQERDFGAALRELQQSGELEDEKLANLRTGWIHQCLDNMSREEIVAAYFALGPVTRESLLTVEVSLAEVSLSPWSDIELAGQAAQVATLKVLAGDLSARVGSSLSVFLFADLQVELVTAVAQHLRRGGLRSALLLSDGYDEVVPVGLLVSQLRDEKPPLHLIELRLAEIWRQILDRDRTLTYLRRQVEHHFENVADLYLKGIDIAVFEDGKFFGRAELLAALTARIDNQNSFAVFGMRRLGKTSLLKRLDLVNKLDDHVLVLVNLQGVADEAELYRTVGLAIRQKLDQKFPTIPFPRELFTALDWKGYELFRLIHDVSYLQEEAEVRAAALRSCFARDIAELLSRLAGGHAKIRFQRLILLCDEIESILPDPTAGQASVAGYGRFLAQIRELLSSSLFMVGFVGLGPILESELSNHESYLWKQIQLLPLGMLTRDECGEMVSSLGRKRVYFSGESLDEVYLATGGNPRLTKILCAEIIGVRPKPILEPTIQPHEVHLGIASLLAKEHTRSELLGSFDAYALHYPVEAGLVRELAQRNGAMEIRRDDQRQRLIDYGFVTSRGRSCTLRCGLLRESLRHRHSLGLTLPTEDNPGVSHPQARPLLSPLSDPLPPLESQ